MNYRNDCSYSTNVTCVEFCVANACVLIDNLKFSRRRFNYDLYFDVHRYFDPRTLLWKELYYLQNYNDSYRFYLEYQLLGTVLYAFYELEIENWPLHTLRRLSFSACDIHTRITSPPPRPTSNWPEQRLIFIQEGRRRRYITFFILFPRRPCPYIMVTSAECCARILFIIPPAKCYRIVFAFIYRRAAKNCGAITTYAVLFFRFSTSTLVQCLSTHGTRYCRSLIN